MVETLRSDDLLGLDRDQRVADTGVMVGGRYLEGPDGLRVEPITLDDVHLQLAQQRHPDAEVGEGWFLITRHGRLVCYCRDIEEVAGVLASLAIELADLHSPGEAAEDAG